MINLVRVEQKNYDESRAANREQALCLQRLSVRLLEGCET